MWSLTADFSPVLDGINLTKVDWSFCSLWDLHSQLWKAFNRLHLEYSLMTAGFCWGQMTSPACYRRSKRIFMLLILVAMFSVAFRTMFFLGVCFMRKWGKRFLGVTRAWWAQGATWASSLDLKILYVSGSASRGPYTTVGSGKNFRQFLVNLASTEGSRIMIGCSHTYCELQKQS